jgi:hypothetical protein
MGYAVVIQSWAKIRDRNPGKSPLFLFFYVLFFVFLYSQLFESKFEFEHEFHLEVSYTSSNPNVGKTYFYLLIFIHIIFIFFSFLYSKISF